MYSISTKLGSALLVSIFLFCLVSITSSSQELTRTYNSILSIAAHTQLAQISGAGSGLVAHYTFDEGSGTTAGDSAGSNTGTLVNGPTWVTGKIGQGVQFDGVDDRISIGKINIPVAQTSLTVSAWVKLMSSPSTDGPIVYRSTLGDGVHSSIFDLALEGVNHTNPVFSASVSNAGGTHYKAVSSTRLVTDQWYHLVGVSDGIATVTLYVNGIATTGTFLDFSGFFGETPQYPAIGTKPNVTSDFFKGNIDDVRIYSRALTPSEISELYSYTGGSTTPTPVNGSCSLTINTCTTGTFSDTTDTTTNSLWSCTGSNGGTTASCSLPIPPPSTDTTPPTISSIQSSSITTTGATISWTTNESSDTQIEYGLTTSYGSNTTLNSSLLTSHSQSLTGLTANTTYHYRVKSKDAAGNLTTSSDMTFSTSAVVAPPVSGSHIYIAQTQAGTGDASSCLNAKAITFFNTASNWGAGGSQIGPGKTVHLCGTISTALVVQGSGTSGNPITVLFEAGAKMSALFWSLPAAISVVGKKYIVIDGGSSKGVIESTDTGTLLGYKEASRGVHLENPESIEIKNLLIRNMYVRTPRSSDSVAGSRGISIIGKLVDISIHNNTIIDAHYALFAGYSKDSVRVSIYENDISRTSTGIILGSTDADTDITGADIYGNRIYDQYVWDGIFTNGSWFHNDGIHVWAASANSRADNVRIYNNYIYGDNGKHTTGWIFLDGFVNNPRIFNNILQSTGLGQPSDGMIIVNNKGTGIKIYNNTIVTLNPATCISSAPDSEIKNNILYNCSTGIGIYNPTQNTKIDNNIYLFSRASDNMGIVDGVTGNYSFSSGLIQWRQRTGFDMNSQEVNPQLINPATLDLHLQSTSPAINVGANLSPYFTTDIEGNSRGSTWDIGAYEYTGTQTTTPISGSCSTTINTCTTGTFSDTTDTTTNSLWSCTGSNGGTTASCSLPITLDTTLPTVTLTSPSGTISSTVTLSATASDNIGVTSVQFLIDGSLISTLTTAPYSGSWNTVGVANGTHTLTAIAKDAANNTRTSNPVTITVSNTVTTPPTTGGNTQTPTVTPSTTGGTTVTSSSSSTSSTGTFTPTVTQIPVGVGGMSTSTLSISPYAGLTQLVRNLYRGLTGEDVRTLQRFLVIEGLLTIDIPTTYFGILTETAVKAFQAKNSIVSSGTPYTTGYGSVGPKTRGVINAKIGNTTAVPIIPTPTTSTTITTTLTYNMTDPQVSTLQSYLISKGYLTSQATGYFGSLTLAAVKKLQCEKLSICSGSPESNGYGAVGPRTRAALQ